MENPAPYRAGPADGAEPSLTIEALIAQARAHRRDIPHDGGDHLLRKRPDLLRALADHVLSGKAPTGDVAYAVAAPIDRIESAPNGTGPRRH